MSATPLPNRPLTERELRRMFDAIDAAEANRQERELRQQLRHREIRHQKHKHTLRRED